MAMMKLCKCNKVISIHMKRCEACEDKIQVHEKERDKRRHKRYDENRDKKFTQFYKSPPWIALRRSALVRDNGLCVACLKQKRIKDAEEVDHIIPIKISWELRLILGNLQSLCKACHRKKTREDKEKYKGLI